VTSDPVRYLSLPDDFSKWSNIADEAAARICRTA
jgi:hypothetical protein